MRLVAQTFFAIFAISIFNVTWAENFLAQIDAVNSPGRFVEVLQDILKTNDTRISSRCQMHLWVYLRGILAFEPWALKMFDSGSKLPTGILEGHIADLGNFDECLDVEHYSEETGRILGRYCYGLINISSTWLANQGDRMNFTPLLRLMLPKADADAPSLPVDGLNLATCLPSTCPIEDISEIYQKIGLSAHYSNDMCQIRLDKPLESGTIGTIAFFAVILGIMATSTVYDIFLHYSQKKPAHPLLVAFSVLTNFKKIITLNKNPNQISCLHGIRVLSIVWIIFAHGYLFRSAVPVVNTLDLFKWSQDSRNMYIIVATVSVDTFFLLSGLMVSYGFMNMTASGMKFNIIVYYIHRYLRLTPVLGAILLVYLYLLVPFGSGPLWPGMIPPLVDNCKNYWWSTLLYVQNYVNPYELCIGEAWYLSVDTQLYFLSPIILLPMKRWPKLTLAGTSVLVLSSMAACFAIAWEGGFYVISLANDTYELQRNFQVRYYGATHTRASVWLMGIILGYIVFEAKQKSKKLILNQILVWLLWGISLAILLACVFSGHNLITNKPNEVENAFYAAFMRPSWALGVSWVIYACVLGYGGPVNWLLSLPVFEVLAKLTYGMYLLHLLVIYMILAQLRTAIRFSDMEWMHNFWGNFMFTATLTLIFTLAFESPMIAIERFLFGGLIRSKKT